MYDKKIISPISIDLGAKNTGVYFAHYLAHTSIENIKEASMGKVYQLEKDKYTLLMEQRTSKRHQRRGFDRRQMAKRLFKLIWEKYFNLPWDINTQQCTSFLLNRRGFSFLTEEYDAAVLSRFPKNAFNQFPNEIKNKFENDDENDVCDLNSSLEKWSDGSQEGTEKIRDIYTAFNEKISREEKPSSIWKFKPTSFNLETATFIESDNDDIKKKNKILKNHLNHLTFALYKTLEELESGSRHRSQYFQEIENVLKNNGHTHVYLKNFCENLKKGFYTGLNVDKLKNLIGHISNLELKVLRKYFNDKKHIKDDYFSETRINKYFRDWVIKEWRVSPLKDKYKAPCARYEYKSLKEKLKEHSDGVIHFWMTTCPNWTIPPYQDNNNRRPPRCQSLILNPSFLAERYPKWKNWLDQLKKIGSIKDYLEDFEEKLTNLKSSQGRPYFNNKSSDGAKKDGERRTHEELSARVLQFIFDRSKDKDLLRLNEIYSHAKKYRQKQSTEPERDNVKSKLEDAISRSQLPDTFKVNINYDNDALFKEGSFFHLICKYYKDRQKAREGRIFIHPKYKDRGGNRGYKNTKHFNDRDHLLIYCNHKPRQKRYQILDDVAAQLQFSPNQLSQFLQNKEGDTIGEKLFNWLSAIPALKTNCASAAKEQKDRRGQLKSDIKDIYEIIHRNSDNLEDSLAPKASKLYKLCEKAKDVCLKITDSIYSESRQLEWKRRLQESPERGIYLLAQINNLAFKERGGNAKTCSVCSTDNSMRMQIIEEGRASAKAQRLPAIEARLIDGAVMRIARIVGGAIADDKWKMISKELENNKKVHIPIIVESNRFEFEPNLNELKGRKGNNGLNKYDDIFKKKRDRIKQASSGVSPYSGASLGDTGDLDHIIPRSNETWGILNDEANLIFTNIEDNRSKKGDQQYFLKDLDDRYKKELFHTDDDIKIEEWIVNMINSNSSDDFTFGRYRSFINLTLDQKLAFRHALFLKTSHPLRKKVISAINNRTRAFVNGTQRYFAEVLANKIYMKAKREGRQKLLSFDYFSVESQSTSRGNGIYDLRKMYEELYEEIRKYKKIENNPQSTYSHLIDAQLAFSIISNAHKNDGSLKIQINDSIQLWPVNTKTGEILRKNIFNTIKITPNEMKQVELKRKKT